MTEPNTGSASVSIARPPAQVWAAIADVTRMGEWSPECVACRWVDGADGPATGARFEGDNVAKVGSKVVKRWTTMSEVTACEPGVVFEFVSEGQTTWRYEFVADGTGTTVTERFSYVPSGFRGFIYDTVLRRPAAMTKGMQATLARVKAAIEAQ